MGQNSPPRFLSYGSALRFPKEHPHHFPTMPYIVQNVQNTHAKKNTKNFYSPLASTTGIWYTMGALRDKGSFKARQQGQHRKDKQ